MNYFLYKFPTFLVFLKNRIRNSRYFCDKNLFRDQKKRKEKYLKIPLEIKSAIFIFSHVVILIFLKNYLGYLSSLLTKTIGGPLPKKWKKLFENIFKKISAEHINSINHLEYNAYLVVILFFLKTPKSSTYLWSFPQGRKKF